MFKTFSVKEMMEENRKLKEELKESDRLNKEMNDRWHQECTRYLNKNRELQGEILFLKQRNKELRQKTWFQVYEENLKLVEENKNLDETCQEVIAEYAKLEKEIAQYKSVLESVQTFINQYSSEKKVSKECH